MPENIWRERLFWASIAAAGIVLSVTLLLPLGFDNDVYQSMGWTLYAYHGLPYLASWDMNFPGIVFIHWASIALFGPSDFGFRLFDLLVHIAMAGLYFTVLRRWLSPLVCSTAVVLLALYYAGGQWGLNGQRDEYAVLALLIVALAYFKVRSNGDWHWALLAGVSCGLAVLVRPTYVLFALSLAWLVWSQPDCRRRIPFLLLGNGIPLAAFIIPYLFYHGGLQQIYYSTIRYNLDQYASVSVPNSLISIGRWPIYLFAVIGVAIIILDQRRSGNRIRLDGKFLILFAACSLLSPIVMGKYFTYHFAPIMAIACAFAAIALVRMTGILPSPRLRVCLIALALGGFAIAFYPRHLIAYYAHNWKKDHPLDATYEQVLSDSLNGLRAEEDVIHYLRRVTTPGDRVESASFFPGLRWRLDRQPATRFTSILPLVIRDRRNVPDYMRVWAREFIAAIGDKRPTYIVLTRSHQWWPFANTFADSAAHQIPGFDSLLRANYRPDTIIRGFELFRIR